MPLNPDFRDLLAGLNAAGAKYLVVGGYALAHHAVPRYTDDLDVWIDPTPENAALVHAALRRFGAPVAQLRVEDLAQPGTIFQIGVPPVRVDILTAIDGVSFAEAWPVRVQASYGDQAMHVISRRHLIENKRASGRAQDLADLERLGEG